MTDSDARASIRPPAAGARVPSRASIGLLRQAPAILLIAIVCVFSVLAPGFLAPRNLVNILVQSSSIGVLAVGMTFVLLAAGIDLSVGSIMFIAAAVAGKIVIGGHGLPLTIIAIVVIGLLCGACNAFMISGVGMLAFVVTLAMQFVGRGLALMITETKAMNLPEKMLRLGSASILGVPFPILIFAAVLIAGHIVLTQTLIGRHVYAVGFDAAAAIKAGIRVPWILAFVYIVSGLCAGIAGLISVAQLGAVSPTFGNQREFAAIAAAVLGGTSLFGGRGQLVPGTLLGALLVQTIENGLVTINADPYLYPLVTSAIIFVAVLLDSYRHRQLTKLMKRKIRVEAQSV